MRRQSPGRTPQSVELRCLPDQCPLAVRRPAIVQDHTDPARQPFVEVRRSKGGIEVGIKIVQDIQHRGKDLIQTLSDPLREAVLEIDRRQREAERVRAAKAIDEGPHGASTRTWWL